MVERVSESRREHTALQQLVAVHNHFREYLHALRSAVDDTTDDDSEPLPSMVDLRAHCLYFCHGLTTHHTIEDQHWFPQLRRVHPDLAPVIDRLESDHHKVADYLTRIERAANALPTAEPTALDDLRAELKRLSDDLLAHLSYEEESLAEALAVPYG